MSEIIPGIYHHYLGQYYEVLYIATLTESTEQLVIYHQVFPTKPQIWASSVSIFNEHVTNPKGINSIKKFVFVGNK